VARSVANGVAIAFLAISLGLAASASADPVDALFDLRLAAGQDSVLNVGETLNLEVYILLSSTGTIPGVKQWSAFLDLDPSEANIITFKRNFIDQLDFGTVLTTGTDNGPIKGEFSRTVFSTSSVEFGNDWVHAASFSVRALNPGVVTYSFGNAPPDRPWFVGLADSSSASLSALPTPEITVVPVIPEPAAGFLLIAGWSVGLLGHRRSLRRKIGT
jgi:hypothetical protein